MISDCDTALIRNNQTGNGHRACRIPALGDPALDEGSWCVWSPGYTTFSFIRETPWFLVFYYI